MIRTGIAVTIALGLGLAAGVARPAEPAQDSVEELLVRAGEVGVAPGQACAFYESGGPGARILGGGWIARAERAAEAERALDRLRADAATTVSA